MISVAATGQHAFIPEFQFGSFEKIDLITGVKINITTNHAKLVASDFGPGGVLFAINEWTNEFYTVDTQPMVPPLYLELTLLQPIIVGQVWHMMRLPG